MVASVRLILAILGAAMFRFRKARRRNTRKSPTAQELLLTEPEQPTPPRTEERLPQATPPLALPKLARRRTTRRPPPTLLWSGYRPPKRASKKGGRMGDQDYLQLGENHEP